MPACRAGGVPALPQPASACGIDAGAPRPNITVAVQDAVDPAYAPIPRNAAERLVFQQLYETLVEIDCEGQVVPSLAESWSVGEAGRVWRIRLRGDARFWDGSSVTANAVMQSWATHAGARSAATFAAVQTLNDRELRVELHTPVAEPHLFAHRDFSVARPAVGSAWPLGSSPFRVDATAPGLMIRNAQRASVVQSIEFRTFAGTDARAAIDAGVDALVTADATTLAYARALPEYTVAPLAWSRTYVLAARARIGTDSGSPPPRDALLALAREAVREDARPAEATLLGITAMCRVTTPPSRAAASSRRTIVYPRGDAIARGVAERVVALAWPAARAPEWVRALLPADYANAGAPAALALDRRALIDSLRTNRGLAFIVPLPRSAVPSCAAAGDDDLAQALVSAGLRVTPLLDARDHLIHRAGLGRVIVNGDGTIRFAPNTR